MKKTKIALLVLFIGVIFFGCASMKVPSEELIIAPDPDNPFQGTWITKSFPSYYMHVINGMKGEMYFLKLGTFGLYGKEWVKHTTYTIEKKDDGFITSNHWQINVTNDILTVESLTYERYK